MGNQKLDDVSIQSPCTRKCCLDPSDVCVGCFRTLDEITRWSGAPAAQKQQILVNCQVRNRAYQQSLRASREQNE